MKSDAQRAAELLVQFKADLAEVYTRDAYQDRGYVLIAGLLDVAEGLMRRAVRLDQSVALNLLERIDLVRANVERVAGEPSDTPIPPGQLH